MRKASAWLLMFLMLTSLSRGLLVRWAHAAPKTHRPAAAVVVHDRAVESHDHDEGLLPIPRTRGEWLARLSPEAYRVARQKGTEPAFSGEYWNSKTPGIYRCRGCGQVLFSSETKYDSGTGWPSFWAPITDHAVRTAVDRGWFVNRTEVLCSRCGSHLGHVFRDGPPPTGLRYCMNSLVLKLEPVPSGK